MDNSINVINNISFGYSGKVKIKILDGKKLIYSKDIHNKGKWPLFLFFAQCLTGKYSVAERQRPTYIQLFNASDISEDKLFTVDSTWTEKSYPVKISTSPKIDYVTNNSASSNQVESAWGTLKFTIPFSLLINGKDNINLITLKSKENLEVEEKSVAAYITIGKLGGLIPENMNNKEKYTIIIEWTLSIQDQSVVKVE